MNCFLKTPWLSHILIKLKIILACQLPFILSHSLRATAIPRQWIHATWQMFPVSRLPFHWEPKCFHHVPHRSPLLMNILPSPILHICEYFKFHPDHQHAVFPGARNFCRSGCWKTLLLILGYFPRAPSSLSRSLCIWISVMIELAVFARLIAWYLLIA